MSEKTNKQYQQQAKKCEAVFISKNKDYGTNWRILRISTLIDQVFIKANRIRSIEEKQSQKVEDQVDSEYIGIINYSVITLIQMDLRQEEELNISFDLVLKMYRSKIQQALKLMLNKNHDYGEAWRDMYLSSYTDLILAKLLRIKQILENKGETLVSEGIDANLYDIINYSFFALIKLSERDENK